MFTLLNYKIFQTIHFAKSHIAEPLYSNKMSLSQNILLYKTVMKPKLLYEFQVRGLEINSIFQILQTLENKTVRFIRISSWHVRNDTIHMDVKIVPIKYLSGKFPQNSFENFYIIFNMIFFYKILDYEAHGNCSCPLSTLLFPNVIKF